MLSQVLKLGRRILLMHALNKKICIETRKKMNLVDERASH